MSWYDSVGGTEHRMQALTLPDLNGDLRKQCLHPLYKSCKACKLLPASYVLQKVHICVVDTCCCSGFADAGEGEYLGRRVTIEHLRFGTKDAFNKILKGCHAKRRVSKETREHQISRIL